MPLKYTWANGEQFTAGDANDVAIAVNASYTKPGTGIPSTDLASAVQTSLGKADSAVQSVASTNITDATTTGKAVLVATDAATARTALGVAYGSAGGTVAQGNDARFSPASTAISDSTATGRALLTTTDASTARTTLGVAYGSTGGTVAEGNDSRITGAQQTSEKGNANGYASLDSGGKVPITQLPSSIMEYQGTWNASTNSPTLADGTGSTGDVYRVSVGAARNLGSGSITFDVGDYCIYNGTIWQKSDTTDAVSSVAGKTGDVTLLISDITASTSLALGVGTVELGHATDTTLSRSAAGVLAVEGVDVVTTSATQTLTNKTATNPTITNYTESVVAIGTVTTSNTLSLTSGTVQTATLTASTACTFTMPTATAGKSFVLLLKQAASTGNGTATFTSVKWSGGTAPTITATAGKMDILSFFADGTNWYGSATQNFTP
jgi:hypothetical protein